MKKSVLVVAILASALSFGASSAFAAKECSVADYKEADGFCKCEVKNENGSTTFPQVTGKNMKKDCEDYCQSFCKKKPEAKPVKPAPVIGIEL